MPDKKISELDAITGSATAADDFFIIVDSSGAATNKISRAELNNAIELDVLASVDITTANIDGGTIDGTVIGGTTPAAGSFTTLETSGNATIGGDLTVNGTTTTINSTTLTVDDLNITLASGAASAAAADGAGLTVDGASATFNYASTGDKWTMNKPLDVTGTVTADGLTVNSGAVDLAATIESSDSNVRLKLIDGDASNGVFLAGKGENLVFETNGNNERMRIDSSGNVGIGTSSPARTLHINSGAANEVARFESTDTEALIELVDTTGSAQIRSRNDLRFYVNGGSTRAVDIDSSGNVGIGTSSPSTALDVVGTVTADTLSLNSSANTLLQLESTDSFAGLSMADTTGSAVMQTASGYVRFLTGGDASTAGVNATEAMRIDSSGNVGIGTTAPNGKLDIATGGSTDVVAALGGTFPAFTYRNGTGTWFHAGKHPSSNYFYIGSGATPTTSAHVVVDNIGNVGIGTSSPSSAFELSKSGGSAILTLNRPNTNTTGRVGAINFTASDGHSVSAIQALGDGNDEGAHLTFYTTSAASSSDPTTNERMRIDSSGNLLVGTTTTVIQNGTTAGTVINSTGQIEAARDGNVIGLNRLSTDGDIAIFQKDGSTVGSIGVVGADLYIAEGTDVGLVFNTGGNNNIKPCNTSGADNDNSIDLGSSGARFDDIYATNGTIQTSDANEKQQIASLTDAEITAAKAISALFKTFKWNDSVAENGDAARTHTGVIAQEVQQAMTDAGLDAGDYAFFISSTWWETQTDVPAVEADEENGIEAQEAYTRTDTYETAEEAPEGATERTRLGVRYPELLAFIGAATEQRLANIETRLAALEAN